VYDTREGLSKVTDNREHEHDPEYLSQSNNANMGIPNAFTNNMYVDFSSMAAPLMQGGYTKLLLGVDQDASAARKLNFDVADHVTYKKYS
jgi:hypothetical protein